jgi:hypothetical protein
VYVHDSCIDTYDTPAAHVYVYHTSQLSCFTPSLNSETQLVAHTTCWKNMIELVLLDNFDMLQLLLLQHDHAVPAQLQQ